MKTHANDLRRTLLLAMLMLLAIAFILAAPAHGATWQPLGPDGGRVPALLADPFDADVVYAGTFGAGLFRSTDGGRSWERWSQGITDVRVLSLAAGPDGTLYAGTLIGGVFRLERGAEVWEPASDGLPSRYATPCGCYPEVIALAADPVSGVLYAGVNGHALYRSVDRGESWTGRTNGGDGYFRDLTVDPRGSLYIAGDYLLSRSDDGGINIAVLINHWRNSHPTAVVVDPSSPNTVYASFDDEKGDGVLKSTNRGKTWRPVKTGLRNRQVLDLAIDPKRPRTLYASTRAGIFRSDDGGARWRRATRGLPDTRAMSLAVAGGSVLAGMETIIPSGIGPAVYRSDNRGGGWNRSDAGITGSFVGSVGFAAGTVFAGTWGQGLLRQEGEGWVWAGVPGSDVFALLTDLQDPDLLLAATSAGLFRSGNGSGSWERIGPADPRTGQPAEIRGLGWSAGGALLAGGKEWIFKSTDRGETWRAVAEVPRTWVETLVADPASPQTVYASGSAINPKGGSQVAARSTDGGETWSEVAEMLGMGVLAVDRGVVYAVNFSGLLRSRDQGRTWETIPIPPGTVHVGATELLVDPRTPGLLYAAFSGVYGLKPGVYRTPNGGVTWESVGEGLLNTLVGTLKMDTAGDLYAGTAAGGLWKLDL